MDAIFKRSWFSRMWTVQEVINLGRGGQIAGALWRRFNSMDGLSRSSGLYGKQIPSSRYDQGGHRFAELSSSHSRGCEAPRRKVNPGQQAGVPQGISYCLPDILACTQKVINRPKGQSVRVA